MQIPIHVIHFNILKCITLFFLIPRARLKLCFSKLKYGKYEINNADESVNFN